MGGILLRGEKECRQNWKHTLFPEEKISQRLRYLPAYLR